MGTSTYARFIREFERFDAEASCALGDRYLVWQKSRFIDARDPEHLGTLVERFNLRKESQQDFVKKREHWTATAPTYLARIWVFGKVRDTCPLAQATLFDIRSLTSVLRYYSCETPERIIVPTGTQSFSDGNSVYI